MVLEGWMASANSDKDFIKDSSRRASRLLPVSAPISLLKGIQSRHRAFSSAARFWENPDGFISSQGLFAWDIIPTDLQKCNGFFHSYGKNEFCSQRGFRIRHFSRWFPSPPLSQGFVGSFRLKIRPDFETDAEKTRYGPGAFCLGPHLVIKGKRRFLQVVWGQIFSRMSWPILWVPMTCWPGAAMSAVRQPSLSTASTASSMALASRGSWKE